MSTLKKFDKSKLNSNSAAAVAEAPKKEAPKLPAKKAVAKKDKLEEEETIKQVKEIINPPVPEDDQPIAKKKKETMIRITLDLPESMHIKVKMLIVDTGLTMKEYFMALVEKDLKLREKK